MSESSYPATLAIDTPEEVARWRPLVQWVLAIPHYIVLYVLTIVAFVVAAISWFMILITGKLSPGLANLQAMVLRYAQRTYAYGGTGSFTGFLATQYPPFAFDTTPDDPGTYAEVTVGIEPELEDRNRLTTFFRLILVIPHVIVLAVLGFAASIIWFISAIAVVITGKWPVGLRGFVVGVLRWSLRVGAYFFLLTDEYPPFSLD